jgi:uncharacterized membrane protein
MEGLNMAGLLPLVLTAFVLGLVITYVQPYVAGAVPAALQSNKWVAVAVVGGLALISLFIAAFVLRLAKLPRAI